MNTKQNERATKIFFFSLHSVLKQKQKIKIKINKTINTQKKNTIHTLFFLKEKQKTKIKIKKTLNTQ
jgi:hypothetical protein